MLAQLKDRLLSLLGLDDDYAIRFGRDPFNLIDEDLYLGSRPRRADVPALQEAGVTHVVSCLPEDARANVAFLSDDFHALFLPMHDGIHEDIASTFPTFFDFVRTAHTQTPRAKVLVHCEVGVSRSATLVTALVMKRSRQRFFEAYCDVRAKRREILPNVGFASQLQRLELDMHPHADGLSSLARYLREVCTVPVDVETLQSVLHDHDYDATKALRAIFGDEIPRVIQGMRR